MAINFINQRRLLYKQKKLFMINLYALSVLATSFSNSTNNGSNEVVVSNVVEVNEQTEELLYNSSKALEINLNVIDNVSEIKMKTAPKIEQNVYYDFPCSNELQDHIFKVSKEYNIPHEIMMTIIHRESGGKWNTNGVISPTNDYGLPQINICNAKFIEENLGYSMKEILNDPYKATEAQALLLKEIINVYGYIDDIDYKNVFGTYNGWLNWEENINSCEYADACMEIYKEKFNGISRKLD